VKKRTLIIDLGLVIVAAIVLFFLFRAPPETTAHVPYDQDHQKYYDIVHAEGKKAAEKFCEDCHNPDGVPFAENHPGTRRCLLCHKLDPQK